MFMNSTSPTSMASSMTGLPKKSAHKRGRKQSGKPGASHLSALQAAHGQGNLAQAKTHALNYAKAVHQSMTMSDDTAQGDGGEGMQDAAMTAPPMGSAMKPPQSPKVVSGGAMGGTGKPTTTPNPRAMLAKLALRKK